jgi:peptidoglycan hydrolase-like protein with peptidoglycan-binding domain
MLITGSVGKDGANNVTDVRVIQRLLNYWLTQSGRPRLKINGVAGPDTIAAIISFQRASGTTPSGRVEAGPGVEAMFNQHLSKLIDSIDMSVLGKYLRKSAGPGDVLSDPEVSDALKNYIDALRKFS